MGLYLGNLSYAVTVDAITEVFAEYGTVKRVQLPMDRETGKPRGFAFIDMGPDADEDAIIEALNDAEWMGRDIKVNKAKPKEPAAPPTGGSDRPRPVTDRPRQRQ
jgi:RNA recognition motif-containing protein